MGDPAAPVQVMPVLVLVGEDVAEVGELPTINGLLVDLQAVLEKGLRKQGVLGVLGSVLPGGRRDMTERR